MSLHLNLEPVPFIMLPNWVKAATACGFSIEPIFREVGIETDLVHLESIKVSPPMLLVVMEACVAQSVRGHFPFVLGETFVFDYLPDVQTFLTTSPTARDALRVLDWARQLINPLIRAYVVEEGTQAHLVVDLGLVPGSYFVETIFAVAVKFARMLLPAGSPMTLRFKYPPPPHAAAYYEYFNLPIAFDQPRHSLSLEAELLDSPLQSAYPSLHRQAELRIAQRIGQSSSSKLDIRIEALLLNEPALFRRGITAVAERLGFSSRTLQRRLLDQGVQYAEIVARARFRCAARWLDDSKGQDIEAISERLGFSDRRSFTRAFVRWSGLTPSAYRKSSGIKLEPASDQG